MTEKSTNVSNNTQISNPKFRDSSSKIIFADNVLSSQFLRDYADMEILRQIRPEDIEDVSERYVPLYSTERNSDTVKRVDISRYLPPQEDSCPADPARGRRGKRGKLPELPLYIISLVEHKTRVEYNVIMQLFRYTVHIWEDFEKEMEKVHPGISKRKEFRYPPILPIVYYEGTDRWTAPADLADRIFGGELLGKYLPHFRYQLVTLHDYSNEELLAKGDEISLAMLINKIQTFEDLSAFTGLPEESLEHILRDTPEYLLGTLTDVLRALLYHMNLPEDEVEGAVAKIKERKMGLLFENAKLDIREERRKAEEAVRKAEETVRKVEQKAEETVREAEQKAEEAAREAEQKAQRDQAILIHILRMVRQGASDREIAESLMQQFSLDKKQAEEKLSLAFGDPETEE